MDNEMVTKIIKQGLEVVCGKCQHGKLFCYKCGDYEPKEQEV